jgi:hypothetical protein
MKSALVVIVSTLVAGSWIVEAPTNGSGTIVAPAAPVYEAPLSALVPLGEVPYCGECKQNCPEGQHRFDPNTEYKEDRSMGETGHGCQSGFCKGDDPHHPDSELCGGSTLFDAEEFLSPDERARLWDALSGGSPDELRAVVADVGAATQFNQDRAAVQVLGCDGGVVLSLPLSSPQRMAFSDS